MPGCLDDCYLYLEEHSIDHLAPNKQIEIEKELEKYEKGEEYDFVLLKDVVKRKCLGEYLKQPDNLPSNCKHFWELREDLSVDARLAILEGKKNKKWKLITLIVSIIGIVVSSFFAFMNYSKPSDQKLKAENDNLKRQVGSFQREIFENKKMIEKLRNLLEKDQGGEK